MSESGFSKRTLLAGAAIGAGAVLLGGAALNAVAPREGGRFKPRGFSRARAIETDMGPLPAEVDVAIIGGGFAGVCSALSLAKRGVSVALFEKGLVAGEASGRSAGMIESLLCAPSQLPIIEYGKQRWRWIDAAIGEVTGFQQNGNAYLFADQAGVDQAAMWLEGVRGLPNGGARMLSGAEAAALAPGYVGQLAGGVLAPEDGAAEPELAAPAMALGARKAGAKIYQNCAVRGIERAAGRVSGVVTERGAVKASSVVLAGGLWSPMLAHALGLDLPMLQGWVSMASVWPFAGPPPGNVSVLGANVGWRRQHDGGYAVWQFAAISPILPEALSNFSRFLPLLKENASLVGLRFSPETFFDWMKVWRDQPLDRPGVYEAMRVFEPELRGPVIDAGIARLQDHMPAFHQAAVRERWCGAMSMTPDTKPILSAVESVPGLVLATGFYHGLTIGPGIGDLVADIVSGATPALDLSAFRYERLIDGSKLEIYS